MISKHLISFLDSLVTWSIRLSSCIYPGSGQPVSFHLFDRRYFVLFELYWISRQRIGWALKFCLSHLKYNTFLFVEVVCVIETDFFFFFWRTFNSQMWAVTWSQHCGSDIEDNKEALLLFQILVFPGLYPESLLCVWFMMHFLGKNTEDHPNGDGLSPFSNRHHLYCSGWLAGPSALTDGTGSLLDVLWVSHGPVAPASNQT